jgi:hypothetical protein
VTGDRRKLCKCSRERDLKVLSRKDGRERRRDSEKSERERERERESEKKRERDILRE